MHWARVGIVASLFASALARADADEAKQAARRAERHAKAKQFDEAARDYRAAFRAQPLPEYLCNVGVAYFKGDDLPRAQRYLSDCLVIGSALDTKFLARVRKVVDEVERKLQTGEFTALDIAVEPPSTTITIAGSIYDEPFVGSRRIWVPRGQHAIELHAEGHRDEHLEVDARDRAVAVRKVLRRLEPRPTTEPRPAPKVVVETRPAPRRSRTAAVTVTVATGVTALAAAGLYVYARSVAKDAETAADRMTYDDRVDRARAYQHASWITAGVAGLGAVASVYLWTRGVTIAPARDGAMVSLGQRF